MTTLVIFVEHADGAARRGSLEALGAARAAGADCVAVLCGPGAADVARPFDANAPTMTVRDALNSAIAEEMERDEKVFVMGEEVGDLRQTVQAQSIRLNELHDDVHDLADQIFEEEPAAPAAAAAVPPGFVDLSPPRSASGGGAGASVAPAAAEPAITAKLPASPPMTIFIQVRVLSQTV